MKRVLVIYPDADSPHALRIVRPLAMHLPALGWSPVLFAAAGAGLQLPLERIDGPPRTAWTGAASSSGGGVPTTTASGRGRLRACRTHLGRHLATPDRWNVWAFRAAAGLRVSGRSNQFDAVLSSGPPHSAHLVARSMKKSHGIKWLADMRDTWTTNPYSDYTRLELLLDRRVELAVLRDADALSTVSTVLADEVAALHHQPVHVVMNGYEPGEFSELVRVDLTGPLTICYTGSLAFGKRDPALIFRVLARLRAQDRDRAIRVIFRTDDPQLVLCAAREHACEDVLDNGAWVDREEALRLWSKSNVLLLLRWDDPRDEGVPTGKLFEYLGARRPVLSLGGRGGVVQLILQQTGAGLHAEEPAAAVEYLRSLSDWNLHDTDAFTTRHMAAQLAELLEG